MKIYVHTISPMIILFVPELSVLLLRLLKLRVSRARRVTPSKQKYNVSNKLLSLKSTLLNKLFFKTFQYFKKKVYVQE